MSQMIDYAVKTGLSLTLGFFDAVISHSVEPRIPLWFIMLYSTPIEYLMITPIYMAVKRIARKVMQSKK